MAEEFKIGQVLYIVSQRTQQVIPVQVQEIHTKQTVEGQEVVYMVMDPKESGPHDLSHIDGEIFRTSKEVSKFLKDAANAAIERMVKGATDVATSKFGAKAAATDIFAPSKKKKAPKKDSKPQSKPQAPPALPGDMEVVQTVGNDGKLKQQPVKIRSIQDNTKQVTA